MSLLNYFSKSPKTTNTELTTSSTTTEIQASTNAKCDSIKTNNTNPTKKSELMDVESAVVDNGSPKSESDSNLKNADAGHNGNNKENDSGQPQPPPQPSQKKSLKRKLHDIHPSVDDHEHKEEEGEGEAGEQNASASSGTNHNRDHAKDSLLIKLAPDPKKRKLNANNTTTILTVATKQDHSGNENENKNSNRNQNSDNNIVITFANCPELLHASWKEPLKTEFKKEYFRKLLRFLAKEELKPGMEIFPKVAHVFRAFELCPFPDLKVVILGQDPYHDTRQAEGLCFSVQRGLKKPSSLRNIYKEAFNDIKLVDPGHGSLIQWGAQGVLLLNTVLTVQAHKANSHKKIGWQLFTDAVIRCISDKSAGGVVFILWGKQAQKKGRMIDKSRHKLIESAHPSGLSAHRGFFGSQPFSKTNAFLKQMGKEPIDWHISS